MVAAMYERDSVEKRLKRACINIDFIESKLLPDFTTKRSIFIFEKLSLPDEFLQYPAAQWNHQPSFSAAKKIISCLAVTNDHAERAVAMVEKFSGSLTKDEQQLQFLMKVVADHRKKFPDACKRTLLEYK